MRLLSRIATSLLIGMFFILMMCKATKADEHAAYLNRGEFTVHVMTLADGVFTRVANDQQGYCAPLFGCKIGSVVDYLEADPLVRKAVATNWGGAKVWIEGNLASEVFGRAIDRIPFFYRCQCVAFSLNWSGRAEGLNAIREGGAAIGVVLHR